MRLREGRHRLERFRRSRNGRRPGSRRARTSAREGEVTVKGSWAPASSSARPDLRGRRGGWRSGCRRRLDDPSSSSEFLARG
eukprot:2095188-Pyramimonas_sp.AAC.1